jgi:hypothetical protein
MKYCTNILKKDHIYRTKESFFGTFSEQSLFMTTFKLKFYFTQNPY